jgi:alpha-ketoglutarate-dependent taurine dioxygenase
LGLQHKSILEKFQNQIDSVKQTKILLSEGDILIINNNRMLHGRNSFPKNSNRWLTRYWIS